MTNHTCFQSVDPRNRYKDYTIIHVLYCSGDVHAGNVTRDYNDKAGPQGKPVQQFGYHNARVIAMTMIDKLSHVYLEIFYICTCICASGGVIIYHM